ncbi:MAG: hypothetical protein WA949_08215 [Phormidesmis sp.]
MKTGTVTDKQLSNYFGLHRRYHRSVNLERDLNKPAAVEGYILTERASEALIRIASAFGNSDAHRAWTMTGVYGTGKSAFAHYLTALCAPRDSQLGQIAVDIVQNTFGVDSDEWAAIESNIPHDGVLRAVAAGQREPLSWTVARALSRAVNLYFHKQGRSALCKRIGKWEKTLETDGSKIDNQTVLDALTQLVEKTETPVFLIIDELGKNLEFAAHNQGVDDLYLLQQIAELQIKGSHQVYFLGLLHQSFAGYSERLASVEQSEWVKIQGRFEDIPFTESPSQMTRLIGQAIDREQANPILLVLDKSAKAWDAKLQKVLAEKEVTKTVLSEAYPIHPLAALVLPLLCTRYAQNDRSLFTFLTSDEPYAFRALLESTCIDGDRIPTLQIHHLYDYFVESVTGLASRMNLQRWIEIQKLIEDARDQDAGVLKVLKTIGILNLITTTGTLRATPELVALALCDLPKAKDVKQWEAVIDGLTARGLLTYRKQLDELRIWEGSDFNVEAAISELLEQSRTPLAEMLSQVHPMKPLVAQRHYIETGTLRYFGQRYVDSPNKVASLKCSNDSHDGLIVYWLNATEPESIPRKTTDGKPLVWVRVERFDLLRVRAKELQILRQIQKEAPELRSDAVASKEVKYRLVEAERLLDETVAQAFDWGTAENGCWVNGEKMKVASSRQFQNLLSEVCDRTYPQGLKLDNELINRRELTSQGAKARRELIESMIERGDQPRLGLVGYGPEVAMYKSVLSATGIHRDGEDGIGFYPPSAESGANSAWDAVEAFCTGAKAEQRSLRSLYEQLAEPPYGIKHGVIPVLLAAILLYRVDDVGFYKDGTFVPVLGPEHFELLVKDPSRFSVKHFEMVGLRSDVFKELEAILRSPTAKTPTGVRNASLLMIAKPLFNFVKKLPKYTLNTKRISQSAQDVIAVLQSAQEPDDLIFSSLPKACGLSPISTEKDSDALTAKKFRGQLVQCLHDIQTAYDTLLSESKKCLHEAFGVRQKESRLREDLRVRASYLVGQCIEPVLKSFIIAAANETTSDKEWLEALIMIVADKPAKSWSDDDIFSFEISLVDIVKRFQRLEALQKEVQLSIGSGIEAQHVATVDDKGEEVSEVLWIRKADKPLLDRLVLQVLNASELKGDPKLQKAFSARLIKKVLSHNTDELENEIEKAKTNALLGSKKGKKHG